VDVTDISAAVAAELARLRVENSRLLKMLELSSRQAAPPSAVQAGFFEAPPGPVHQDSPNDAKVAFLFFSFREMHRSFPDAEVRGYETLIASMTCDPRDRHVLAAAVRGDAEALPTFNTRDFRLQWPSQSIWSASTS
jgi:hypothetical protein